MTPTPVGMRCPECSGGDGKQEVRRPAYSGEASGFERAPATFTLIGINVAIFMIQLATGGGFDTGGPLVVDAGLCGDAVGPGGACGQGPFPLQVEGGDWWRVISAGFLHGGIIHLALNMFVLYILGTMVEPAIGSVRTVAIYVVALIAGSAGALLLDPSVYTVGASGAIYGLFAAALLIARDRGMTEVVAQLGFWLGLNLLLTFSVSGISIGGHLGGLVGGAIAGFVVLIGERRAEGRGVTGGEIAALLALTAGAFAAALLVAAS
jgi:membrane associated rhomboid family serine protease